MPKLNNRHYVRHNSCNYSFKIYKIKQVRIRFIQTKKLSLYVLNVDNYNMNNV